MDDIIFAHNGHYGGMCMSLQRVALLRRHAQANAPAASYWFRRVLDDSWRRKGAGGGVCNAPLPRLSCFLSRFCRRRLYKSLLTENTVASQKNSSASINTNKAKTTTKSITVVDTWYWSINKISYLPLNKNYQ